MSTRSTLRLLTVTAFLGLASLAVPAADPSLDGIPHADPRGCQLADGLLRVVSGDVALAGPVDLSPAIAAAPDLNMAGVVGALAQMIVESELRDAAVKGRFEPTIAVSVAGSDFEIEVCRDSIVGEVRVAPRTRVRFVVGDFDGDGVTDVAVRRAGHRTWSMDLGARRARIAHHGAGALPLLVEAAGPGGATGRGSARCTLAWLAAGGAGEDAPIARAPGADTRLAAVSGGG